MLKKETEPKPKKVQIPCWIDPATREFIVERASLEGREPGNLCALLVEWATIQLKTAGNSLTLLEWEAVPKGSVKRGDGGNPTYPHQYPKPKVRF